MRRLASREQLGKSIGGGGSLPLTSLPDFLQTGGRDIRGIGEELTKVSCGSQWSRWEDQTRIDWRGQTTLSKNY